MSQGIDFRVDMSDIDRLVALGFALDQLGRNSKYITLLLSGAYNHAVEEFDRATIAMGQVGAFTHMFEWGTAGINTGRSNMRPNPHEDRAKLWTNNMVQNRGQLRVSFGYKPSAALVPNPTTAKTGIPANVIKRLKRHVFWNKAMVLEEGIPVTIKPKPDNAKRLLFVPNIWKGQKGYSMYNRPTQPNVSHESKGTFTMHWLNYWEGEGSRNMQLEVERNFEHDFNAELRRISTMPNQRMEDPSAQRGQQRIRRHVETVRRNLYRRAQERLDGQ